MKKHYSSVMDPDVFEHLEIFIKKHPQYKKAFCINAALREWLNNRDGQEKNGDA